MRINLVTPFSEKDAAKALGARWDSAKKTWYITDVTDLTPFARWIRHPGTTTTPAAGTAGQPKQGVENATPPRQPAKTTVTPSMTDVSHCGCDVLPWEDCQHTKTSGAPPP